MDGAGVWLAVACLAVVYGGLGDPQNPTEADGWAQTTTENIPILNDTTQQPTDAGLDERPDWLDEIYYEELATIEPIEEDVFDLRLVPPIIEADPGTNRDSEPGMPDRPGPDRGRGREKPDREKSSRRRLVDERRDRNRNPDDGDRRPEVVDFDGRSSEADGDYEPPGRDEHYRDELVNPDEGPFDEREPWGEDPGEAEYDYGGWIGRAEDVEARERARDRENDELRLRDIGKKLVVTTRLEAPFLTLKQQVQFVAGNDRFEGYLADILRNLAQSIGFEYEIRLVRDGKLGAMNALGVWDGMIGEIERGESDIAAGSLSVTPQREQAVEFTESFLTLRSSALLHKPNRRGNNGQGRIKELEQLLQSNYSYGLIQGGESEQFLRHTREPVYRSMYSRMVNFWPPGFVRSLAEGIERVRRSDYAFIIDSPMAEFVANKKPCEFYTLEPFLDLREYAFAMRKGDRLRRVIDTELKKLKQSGEMQNMYLRWWMGECNPKPQTTPAYTTTISPWRFATAAQGGSSRLLPHPSASLFVLLMYLAVRFTNFETLIRTLYLL